MPAEHLTEQTLAGRVVGGAARHLRDALTSSKYLEGASTVTAKKGDDHLKHRIDEHAEEAIFALLRADGYQGTVFSEEAGAQSWGDDPGLFVTDPYCNTTLTFHGVRDSAVTGFEIGPTGRLVSAAIADVQLWRTLTFGDAHGVSLAWEDGGRSFPSPSGRYSLDQALVVMSLLKRKRRAYLRSTIARECGTLLTVDGGIVALRICAGEVDAFVDHIFGQPAYEAMPYRLVELTGGVVTDGQGRPISWEDIADELRAGVIRRQSLVVANSTSLHEQIMERISADGIAEDVDSLQCPW